MRIKNVVFLVLILSGFTASAQQNELCKSEFDKLLFLSNKKTVNKSEMEEALQIAKFLYQEGYSEYIDSISNNTLYVSHNLTYTFASICILAEKNSGVISYLKYLDFTVGSAEEERAFSFDRIFVAHPEMVLEEIVNTKKYYDHLIWGFLNNRYFESAKSVVGSKLPELTKNNCREIFFLTNPSLTEKYDDYKDQIDLIIEGAIVELENQ